MRSIMFFCFLLISSTGLAQNQSSENLNEFNGESTSPNSEVTATEESNAESSARSLPARPVIEMTNDYIDHQISEIKKVIKKNEGNPNFNLSGYQKRIEYLESRRPDS